MQVRNGLTGIRAAVGNDTEASGQGSFRSNLFYCLQTGRDFLIAEPVNLRDGFHMLFRDNQHMKRGLRVDVPEGKNPVILTDPGRRNFPIDDFTEKTVIPFTPPFRKL